MISAVNATAPDAARRARLHTAVSGVGFSLAMAAYVICGDGRADLRSISKLWWMAALRGFVAGQVDTAVRASVQVTIHRLALIV